MDIDELLPLIITKSSSFVDSFANICIVEGLPYRRGYSPGDVVSPKRRAAVEFTRYLWSR